MASRSLTAAATPSPKLYSTCTTATPSPGNWRHPKFDEITRRQNASTFNEKHMRKILWNTSALIISFILGPFIIAYISYIPVLGSNSHSVVPYLLNAARLCLCLNITSALLPLFRNPDNLCDIPLTPSQRALLGLDPKTSSVPTPGTVYVTPPRYPRSSTPRSGPSGGRSTSYSTSPLSGKGNLALGKSIGVPGFSPAASPLLQKAMGSSTRDSSRRHSYGSPSPIRFGLNEKDSMGLSKRDSMGLNGRISILANTPSPVSPSPSGSKGAGMGLPSRWLYEKGRNRSNSRGLSDW